MAVIYWDIIPKWMGLLDSVQSEWFCLMGAIRRHLETKCTSTMTEVLFERRKKHYLIVRLMNSIVDIYYCITLYEIPQKREQSTRHSTWMWMWLHRYYYYLITLMELFVWRWDTFPWIKHEIWFVSAQFPKCVSEGVK